MPPEPKEEEGEPISKLRIRTPSGEFLERRFLGSCKLQVLFDFVASKGYPSDEFKLLTTFPRRNVSLIPHIFYTTVAKISVWSVMTEQNITLNCCPVLTFSVV